MEGTPIKIFVNGDSKEVASNSNIFSFLQSLKISTKHIAIEINATDTLDMSGVTISIDGTNVDISGETTEINLPRHAKSWGNGQKIQEELISNLL